MTSSRRTLLLILLAALVLRVGFVLTREDRFYFPDSIEYSTIASNVLAGRGFILSDDRVIPATPGYPAFMAAVFAFSNDSLLAVRLVQAVLGALSCWLVFELGRRLFDEKAGLWAAAIAGVYPFLIFYTGLALTETLFVFLLLAFMLCVCIGRARGGWMAFVVAGVLAGAAALVRQSSLGLFIFLVPFLLLARSDRRSRGGLIVRYALCLVVMSAVMSPWIVRNYRICGRFLPGDLDGGGSLYEGNSPGADGAPALDRIEWPPALAGLSECERDAFLRHEAVAWIRANPGRFLRLAAAKVGRTWNAFPNNPAYRSSIYLAISLLSYAPVMILAFAGALRLRGARGRAAAVLLVPAVYISLVHVVFVGSIRYRLAAMPFLIVLAGEQIATLIGRRRMRNEKA